MHAIDGILISVRGNNFGSKLFDGNPAHDGVRPGSSGKVNVDRSSTIHDDNEIFYLGSEGSTRRGKDIIVGQHSVPLHVDVESPLAGGELCPSLHKVKADLVVSRLEILYSVSEGSLCESGASVYVDHVIRFHSGN